VGIAAPQIGVPLRMFLVDAEVVGRPEGEPPVAFINPELVWKSDERERAEEGCLSFPGIYVTIERPAKARVRAMGIDGEMFETEGDELLARALQHEYDHLTGKLFIDFVGPLKKKMIRRKLKREAEAGSTGRAAIS
ncbi:MAG TPA: peptide deformylase, partial [Kofleriaceae bacterium]|nr:peptide deformylase [Kofleriaceae bacterium]